MEARPRPRFYYGWIVAGTLAATETVSWGILYYAFSVFLVPMQRELGWSPAEMTGAYSLALLISGLAAIPVGRWLDRHGPRALMTAGSIGGTLLVLAWSRVDSLTSFYLIWALLGIVMAATLYEPAFAVVATWFERQRAKALLLVTFAAGFASTIFLPVATWLDTWLGWREALVALAAILAVATILPHAFLLRRRPEDLGLRPDGISQAAPDSDIEAAATIAGVPVNVALHDPAFWWLTASFFLGTLASVAIGVHLIPFLIERGQSPGFAATATGLIGATQVAARVIVTLLHDRWRQSTVTAVVFILQGLAIVILLRSPSAAGVLAAVVLLGVGRGAVTLTRAGMVAEMYGRANYGAIGGALAFFVTLARAAAPVGAGLAYAWGDGYDAAFWGLVILSGLAALAMFGVRAVERPLAQITGEANRLQAG